MVGEMGWINVGRYKKSLDRFERYANIKPTQINYGWGRLGFAMAPAKILAYPSNNQFLSGK